MFQVTDLCVSLLYSNLKIMKCAPSSMCITFQVLDLKSIIYDNVRGVDQKSVIEQQLGTYCANCEFTCFDVQPSCGCCT